ncbi:MAG: TetR/AcrR family transcriptional regulator [Polyangiaceae bacterium]|jgi:AcrR family transcriptional regulator|nr:TetR/AcrR family transcriptional regulator [Polyangiaceae bacterium]
MAQRLKPEVRDRILDAATHAFVQSGYEGARLADIAAAAEISTGNVYRYFADKNALFDAIVPRSLAASLLRLLRARVRAIGQHADWTAATIGGSPQADALLDFWLENRLAMVILLGRAQGSPLAHVRPLVEAELTRMSSIQLRAHGGQLSPETSFVLRRLFAGTIDMIVQILEHHDEAAAIRRAFAAFWRFQLAGLQSLFDAAQSPDPGAERPRKAQAPR